MKRIPLIAVTLLSVLAASRALADGTNGNSTKSELPLPSKKSRTVPAKNFIDGFIQKKLQGPRRRSTAVSVPDGGVLLIGGAIRINPKKVYKIDLKIVEVQEDTNVNALAIKVHPHPFARWNGKGHNFTSMTCLKCHSVPGNRGSKKGNSNEYFLKMFHGNSAWLNTWVKNTKGVNVLASPTLTVTAGREASALAGSGRKVQYFQKDKSGRFLLKHENVHTGIKFKVVVQDAADGNVRLNPLAVSVAAIQGREKIPGVSLAVGKPIQTTTSISTSILSKLGKSSVISIDSPRGGRVLISVKVTVHVPGKVRVGGAKRPFEATPALSPKKR